MIQVNKSKSGNVNGEIVTVSRTTEVPSRGLEPIKGPEASRIAQLEQNIRFLQEQHQLMLSGLHHEIESLRNRNKGSFPCNSYIINMKQLETFCRASVPIGFRKGIRSQLPVVPGGWIQIQGKKPHHTCCS